MSSSLNKDSFLWLIILFIFTILGLINIYIFLGDSELKIRWHNPLISGTVNKPKHNLHGITLPSEIATKWIIVTTISLPTQQIRTLSTIPGWQLLVLADKKTPLDWEASNTILLSVKDQLNLGYRTLDHIPWNSYTRKIIGYLYAIEHGAQYIYDTDDDNAPNNVEEFEKGFVLENITRGLTLLSTGEDDVVNPYVHFGQKTIWPRGFPLDLIGSKYNNTYTLCRVTTPLIQQGLVNGDPDVDAIFRLTRKSLHSPLNIKFDGHAPPLIFPEAKLAPFNSQNTLFHYNAFWGLLLPTSVTFRVTDIWRGYWAQRLLWEVGGTLGFFPPKTKQIRNNHTYLRDFGEEDQMYTQSGILAKLLLEWECEENSLYACIMQLTEVMATKKMLSDKDVELTRAWIADLELIGYKVPPIKRRSSPCLKEDNSEITQAVFTGANQDKTTITRQQTNEYALRKLCNMTLNSFPKEKQAPITFPTTLLVITFNHPHYQNIWILDAIYRSHFANILYCGVKPNSTSIDDLLLQKEFIDSGTSEGISFVYANVNAPNGTYPPIKSPNGAGATNGFFVYECALRAVQMGYVGLTGYMVIGDDVLFNFWNNGKYNAQEAWMYHKYAGLLSTKNPDPNGWWWWGNSIFGVNATETALKSIYDESAIQPVTQFRRQRELFGYNSTTAMYGWTDIYYFPASREDIIYEVGCILRQNGVFLEIAVPFLLTGLSSLEEFVVLPGAYNGGFGSSQREHPFDYYSVNATFMHSVKLSGVISNMGLRRLYCSNFIGEVIKN